MSVSMDTRDPLEQLDAYELGEGWPYEEKEKRACKKLARKGLLEVVPGGELSRPCYRITTAGRELVAARVKLSWLS